MKRLFILIILLYCNNIAYSQTDSSFIEKSDFITATLNKSNIPFGVLYDRVAQYSNLQSFNGVYDSAFSGPVHYQQAYFEYYNSVFNKEGLLTPQVFANDIVTEYQANTHPLGLLTINYVTIDPLAVNDGKLIVEGGQLYDVDGSSSPYNVHAAYVAAGLTDGLPVDTGHHLFFLDKKFIISNMLSPIRSLQVDFNDGNGSQTRILEGINPDNYSGITPFEADFYNEDVNMVNVLIEFLDGSTVHTKFGIEVAQRGTKACADCVTIQGCDGGDQLNITGDIYPQLSDYGITPTQATGKAYVFYADANCASHHITKPVVFIDGYDPDNSRSPEMIYSHYINKILPNQTLGLADNLRQLGYDIIVLDFADGGTYIENNAMVVSKLLQSIWQQHSTTIQKNIVLIGPSMGALVGQFALAHMEHNNIPHHTRLYMSFDGPHQGANVPIGLQEMVEYALQSNSLNNLTNGALSSLKHNIIENIAARQMLVHHKFANSQSPKADIYRDKFLTHLLQQGTYAQNLRKVAVINGNRNGILNADVAPCDKLARLQNYINAPSLPIPRFLRRLPGLGAFTPPISINIDWTIFSGSDAGSCTSGKFFTLYPLGAIVGGIPQGWTNTDASGLNGNRSYDKCPGSRFGVSFEESQNTLESKLGWLPFNNFDLTNISKFTFIPTSSAADYTTSSPDIYTNFKDIILAKCAGTTPFDRVYANDYSTDHVAVDENIGNRFLNEIQEIAIPFETATRSVSMNNSVVCDGQSTTLTFDVPNGSIVLWNVPSDFQILNGNGTKTLTIKKIQNNTSGVYTITATCSTSCGNFIGTANLTAGIPTPTINFRKKCATCCDYEAYGEWSSTNANVSYSWSIDGSNFISSINNYGTFTPQVGASTNVWLRVSNSCGTKTIQSVFNIQPQPLPNPTVTIQRVFPNTPCKYSATVTPYISYLKYEWKTNYSNNYTVGGQNFNLPTFTSTSGGYNTTKYLYLRVTDDCKQIEIVKSFTYNCDGGPGFRGTYIPNSLNYIVSPNPSNSIWSLSGGVTEPTLLHLEMFDVSGRKVYSKEITDYSGSKVILNPSLNQGTYFLKIKTKFGMCVQKLVKE